MDTRSELERIREDLWRMRRELEDQIEAGRDARNPWQVMEQHWDEIRRRVDADDHGEETKRLMSDLRARWEKLRGTKPEQDRGLRR